ncbi:MAG: alkaline phosphatase family protein [Candidatus Cybelea sp.]
MKRLASSRYALSFCVITLVLTGCGGAQVGSQRSSSALLSSAGGSASQYLSHVIVIIQENRSFENFFAGYPGANAPVSGCAVPAPGQRATPAGRRGVGGERSKTAYGCPPHDVMVPLRPVTFETNSDLNHNWHSSIIDWHHGGMDGFSKRKDGKSRGYPAYEYVEHSQIAPYWTIAEQYVLADAMFPTEFGGSFTAHLTLVAGTDDIELPGEAEVDFPNAAPDDCDSPPGTKSSYLTQNRKEHFYKGPFPCFDQFNTIAQVLDSAGISWQIYASKIIDAGFWEPFEAIKYVRYGQDWSKDIIAPQTRVLLDAGNGHLASVDWVTPSKQDSDHPADLSDTGPSWVASVVNAIGESAYWPSSAIVILWDDWGGFYDNAPPPQLDYRGLGIRVPCLIISPYAKKKYVSHVQYEYGSILRFIEEVYGIPPGSIGPTVEGYTDERATSLDDAFDFTQKPRQFVPIPSKYPTSYFLHEPPSNEPVDTE